MYWYTYTHISCRLTMTRACRGGVGHASAPGSFGTWQLARPYFLRVGTGRQELEMGGSAWLLKLLEFSLSFRVAACAFMRVAAPVVRDVAVLVGYIQNLQNSL